MQPERPQNYWQPTPEDVTPADETTVPTPVVNEPAAEDVSTVVEPPQPTVAAVDPIRWRALEHIPHERNALWFIGFALLTLVFMAIAIFLVRSVTFTLVLAVAAAAVIVYTRRPPREISYTLSQKGLYVDERLYNLGDYKAFGVIQDGTNFSIMLIPTKRFMPGLVVYFPSEAGESIVDMLGQRLPMQKLELDFVDRLVRKLRL